MSCALLLGQSTLWEVTSLCKPNSFASIILFYFAKGSVSSANITYYDSVQILPEVARRDLYLEAFNYGFTSESELHKDVRVQVLDHFRPEFSARISEL